MNVQTFFTYLIVMAGVTYLIRAIPLTAFTGKVENKFIKSFLAYVPYAVLGAMTFPAIFYSTADLISGIAGTIVGVILAYRRKSLLTVAAAACFVVLLVSVISKMFYF